MLDIKDENPLPKNAGPTDCNRSIVILTPQRALKFSAMSLERHYLWLTALSFLSHSSLAIDDLATLPSIPSQGFDAAPAPSMATLRRNPIRDSIRVAKGKTRPQVNGGRAFTTNEITRRTIQDKPLPEYPDPEDYFPEEAAPPTVPRFSAHAHTRKRSNTAPRMPPSAFRSFSAQSLTASSHSLATPAPPEIFTTTISVIPGGYGNSNDSRQGSEVGSTTGSGSRGQAAMAPNIGGNNFFDPASTRHMEAFVDRVPDVPRQRQSYRTREGRKKDMAFWGAPSDAYTETAEGPSRARRTDDPFRNF